MKPIRRQCDNCGAMDFLDYFPFYRPDQKGWRYWLCKKCREEQCNG